MKKAFTMLELIFVIVIIGILSVIILPRTQANSLQEAGVQLLSDIRYTQHLALLDDKFDPNDPNWMKGRWQIVFAFNGNAVDNNPSYTIFSDNPNYGGDASSGEMARNPQNSDQVMTGGHTGAANLTVTSTSFIGMKKMNLGYSYGVSSISRTGGCLDLYHLTFDEFGRPIKGTHTSSTNSHTLITSDCNLTLSDGINNLTITIRPETGYASITQYQ